MSRVSIIVMHGNSFSRVEKFFDSHAEAEAYASVYRKTHAMENAEFMACDSMHFGQTFYATGRVANVLVDDR